MTGNEVVVMGRAWLRRYVVLTPAQELVLVLWCLHTWVYSRLSRTTPYVELTGVSGSGKTAVMESCALLSRGSLILNTLRTIAMATKIVETAGDVSFFVDEAERLEKGAFGDQRSMLASGYREGGYHMVTRGKATQMLPSFCPKMFTSMRTLTQVLHNRSIPVWMERGKPAASMGREWERAKATAAEVIEAFRQVMRGTTKFESMEPTWLHRERDQEIWTPLFSLAATLKLDKTTMDELTAASVDLSALRGIIRTMDCKDADESASERSYAIRLIQDVCNVVKPGEVWLRSEILVQRLLAIPTAPWRHYGQSGLTTVSMAQLLKAHGLQSKVKRVNVKGGESKGRGESATFAHWNVAAIQAVKL